MRTDACIRARVYGWGVRHLRTLWSCRVGVPCARTQTLSFSTSRDIYKWDTGLSRRWPCSYILEGLHRRATALGRHGFSKCLTSVCSIITAFKLAHRLSGVYKVCGCIAMVWWPHSSIYGTCADTQLSPMFGRIVTISRGRILTWGKGQLFPHYVKVGFC